MDSVGNPVAVVTGGAFGIGRALCERLAVDGAIVVIADINIEEANTVAATIRRNGGRAEAVLLDVSHEAEVQRVVNDVVTAHGRLDYMFNNAAIAAVGEFRDGTMADFRRVMDVNLFGVVHGTKAAYAVMRRQGFGHILNMGSITGLMPTPILTGYSASKSAIIGFSTAVRQEAAGLHVKVSVACPGLVRTSMGDRNIYWSVRKEDHLAQLPLRWAISPEQAAKAILRGVARNQEMIIFPLSARLAWWAQRAFPHILAPYTRRMLERYRTVRITS